MEAIDKVLETLLVAFLLVSVVAVVVAGVMVVVAIREILKFIRVMSLATDWILRELVKATDEQPNQG